MSIRSGGQEDRLVLGMTSTTCVLDKEEILFKNKTSTICVLDKEGILFKNKNIINCHKCQYVRVVKKTDSS